jgi:hypothetical protein
MGQVEEAWNALEIIQKDVGMDRLDPQIQSDYRVVRIQVAAARGDFTAALKDLDYLITMQERSVHDEHIHGTTASIAAALCLNDAINMVPFGRIFMSVYTDAMMVLWEREAQQIGNLHSLYSMRGMLSLEFGDNQKAAEYFAKALHGGVRFSGRPAAERYLQILQRELAKR